MRNPRSLGWLHGPRPQDDRADRRARQGVVSARRRSASHSTSRLRCVLTSQPTCPDGITATSTSSVTACGPIWCQSTTPRCKPLVRALGRAYDDEVLFTGEGGSGPEADIAEILQAPLVFLGVGLPTDRVHAPDEHAVISVLLKGAETAAYLWDELAALSQYDPSAAAVGPLRDRSCRSLEGGRRVAGARVGQSVVAGDCRRRGSRAGRRHDALVTPGLRAHRLASAISSVSQRPRTSPRRRGVRRRRATARRPTPSGRADARGRCHLSDVDAGLLAHAAALEQWHARHVRCPLCGAATVVALAGHVRRCVDDGSEHYPRTDPP